MHLSTQYQIKWFSGVHNKGSDCSLFIRTKVCRSGWQQSLPEQGQVSVGGREVPTPVIDRQSSKPLRSLVLPSRVWHTVGLSQGRICISYQSLHTKSTTMLVRPGILALSRLLTGQCLLWILDPWWQPNDSLFILISYSLRINSRTKSIQIIDTCTGREVPFTGSGTWWFVESLGAESLHPMVGYQCKLTLTQ